MKTKNIKEKIKEYFFQNPTEKLRVRQIERKLNLPLPSIIRYTKELQKEGILKKLEVSKVNFYSAYRISKEFLIEKKLYNIKILFYSELVSYLIEKYHNPLIIIFGSFSKGEDIESSDIDMYIETQKKEEFDLNKFENILNRKIQIFNYKNINEIKNKELSNNIINGIILNGFLEVFK